MDLKRFDDFPLKWNIIYSTVLQHELHGNQTFQVYKIADLGLAKSLVESSVLHSMVGTQAYWVRIFIRNHNLSDRLINGLTHLMECF